MRVLLGGGLETAKVQRRRKAKSKPRDVFSNTTQNQRKQTPKNPVVAPVEPKKPAPKSPPPKPVSKPEPAVEPVEELENTLTKDAKESDLEKEIIENQDIRRVKEINWVKGKRDFT